MLPVVKALLTKFRCWNQKKQSQKSTILNHSFTSSSVEVRGISVMLCFFLLVSGKMCGDLHLLKSFSQYQNLKCYGELICKFGITFPFCIQSTTLYARKNHAFWLCLGWYDAVLQVQALVLAQILWIIYVLMRYKIIQVFEQLQLATAKLIGLHSFSRPHLWWLN